MIVLAGPNQIRVVIGKETEAAAALTGAAVVDISEALKVVGTQATLQLTFTRSEAEVAEAIRGQDMSYMSQPQQQRSDVDGATIRALVKEHKQ